MSDMHDYETPWGVKRLSEDEARQLAGPFGQEFQQVSALKTSDEKRAGERPANTTKEG